MKSNSAKRRLLNLTYRALNSEFGHKVKIKRDPLCRRYEVNRYCASVSYRAKTPSPNEIVKFLEGVMKRRYPDCNTEKDAFGYTLKLDGLVYHMYIAKGMDNKEWVNVGIF